MLDFSVSMHYSPLSVAFYVSLGLVGMFCIYNAKMGESQTCKEAPCRNKYLFAWWFVWVFLAVFRFVNFQVGGSDAPTYIDYFKNCNGATVKSWYEHVNADLGFKWITKSIRFITAEYKVYFLALYGFMAFAYIGFIKKFTPLKTNFVPFVLVFFLFLRSYNTIRSNFAIALIMSSCVFIAEKKWKWAYLIALSSLFIHKSSVLYAMVIPFCHYFSDRKLSVKTAILLVLGASVIGRSLQSIFLTYANTTDLNGAYESYASHSIGVSFFENAWKIAFEQIALAVMMLLMRKRIGNNHEIQNVLRLKAIWTICIFDFICIPMNFIMGSWRGYEYFYLARVVMWGECLYQLTNSMSLSTRKICNVILLIVFVSWMVFRINATWEDSRLLPYIFEPILWVR